jgi:hypothetical protein
MISTSENNITADVAGYVLQRELPKKPVLRAITGELSTLMHP